MGKWDMQFKSLITENPQDFVSLVLEGATVLEKVEGEFQTREMRSDTLFKCRYLGTNVLLLVELQVKRETQMGDRLLGYCFEARRKYHLPIKACVIYLKKIAGAPQPPHTWTFPPDDQALWFNYLSLHIAELSVEELLPRVRVGTSPLLLLSKGGARRETLEGIIQQFEEQRKAESLNVARLIAGLIFTKQADQEWIERRFAVMHDFLWENSWTYRQSVEQGIEKGLAQGLEKGIGKGIGKGIERVVQARFPALSKLLRRQIASIQDQETLLQISVAMSTAETEQAARQYLLALETKK